MKFQLAIVTAALALTACGGNYSNEDLEYLNAFPRREDLLAKVPESATATNSGALQSRQDALAVGDLSKTYVDTRNGSVAFNNLLDFFLLVIEEVRKHPPTARAANRRVWGPLPDGNHPEWNVQVVMVRADEKNFDWFIEFRKKTAPKDDPWLIGASGKFLASSGIRKGEGEVHVFLQALREQGLTGRDDKGEVNQIDITYVTDSLPISVDMQLEGTTNVSVDYSFREYEPGRATMWFVVDKPRTVEDPLRPHEVLTIRSGWNKDGAGRAKIFYENKTANPAVTATGEECWDSNFRVVYFNRPWETPATGGTVSSCVTVEGI